MSGRLDSSYLHFDADDDLVSRAMNCMGIPVRYDPDAKMISDSRGLLCWKKITVGPAFWSFDTREKQAILLHEVGHCKLFHLEKRLFHLLWPFGLGSYCENQEYQADAFAAFCGYGLDLAAAFTRIRNSGGPFHPTTGSRIHKLLEWSDRWHLKA